jgi:hypothetical protein
VCSNRFLPTFRQKLLRPSSGHHEAGSRFSETTVNIHQNAQRCIIFSHGRGNVKSDLKRLDPACVERRAQGRSDSHWFLHPGPRDACPQVHRKTVSTVADSTALFHKGPASDSSQFHDLSACSIKQWRNAPKFYRRINYNIFRSDFVLKVFIRTSVRRSLIFGVSIVWFLLSVIDFASNGWSHEYWI